MQNTAHRFTVLLPVPASLAFDTDEHQRRLDLCRRIVDLEKPAHTVFDARFYWDMFRVGEARLQLDTFIDQGSRAPQLLPNLILGRGFVGESYLAPPALEDANDRDILGRDAPPSYFKTLAAKCGSAVDYRAVHFPRSLPNYLGATGGRTVTTADCLPGPG